MSARALCLVDARSLWKTSIKQFGAKVDFRRLRRTMLAGRLGTCIIYLGLDPLKDQRKFLSRVVEAGFLPKIKVTYESERLIKNIDWFPEIVFDIKTLMDKHTTLSIAATDQRLADAMESVISSGKQVNLYCWSDDIAGELTAHVTDFFFLDESVLMRSDLKRKPIETINTSVRSD